MSTYRGVDPLRQAQQLSDTVFRFLGHTATWRQFISAQSGSPHVGMRDVPFYREQTITALFGGGGGGGGAARRAMTQMGLGMIASDRVVATTREPLGVRDELVWAGVVYRVESEPLASGPNWVVNLKRGE